MDNSGFLNMLGIAKRASLLSEGHDTCMASLKNGKARLCLIASDASDRLCKEFRFAVAESGNKIPIARLNYTMNDFGSALGYRVAVVTVNDAGIADKLIKIGNLLNGEEI